LFLQELEPEPEPEPAPGVVGGGDVERKRLAFYDVTTALQLRIEEKSRRGVGMRLRLETDTDYAEQQGFADPCMGVKKQLRIAYSWRGQQFLAVPLLTRHASPFLLSDYTHLTATAANVYGLCGCRCWCWLFLCRFADDER